MQRFGELEQRELLTGIAQVASDTTVLKDGVLHFHGLTQFIEHLLIRRKGNKG